MFFKLVSCKKITYFYRHSNYVPKSHSDNRCFRGVAGDWIRVIFFFFLIKPHKVIPDLRELYKDYSLQQFMYKKTYTIKVVFWYNYIFKKVNCLKKQMILREIWQINQMMYFVFSILFSGTSILDFLSSITIIFISLRYWGLESNLICLFCCPFFPALNIWIPLTTFGSEFQKCLKLV